MTAFALVHGAWHGTWCWERLIPELERRGHDAIAVDLPCEDVEAGVSVYREAVLRALDGTGDDLVLVGHSLAGLTIPLVAAARPVRALVFLCALIPQPGLSLVDQLAQEPDVFAPGFGDAIVRDELGRSSWATPDAAIAALYADCEVELQQWAVSRLRPQARLPNVEPCPLLAWPDVPSAYVLCRGDAAVAPAWSRRAARDRLGVEAIELDGDHSPFLSRPVELAAALCAAPT